jgi:uncharacterized protein YegL
VLLLAAAAMLPWAALPTSAAAADGSTTVLVLDVSGSMEDPARIPPDFPQAAKLRADEDAVGRLVEQAHPGRKIPLSVIAGGLMGLPELLSLRSDLNSYLQSRSIDPESISKLAALKAAAGALLTATQFERDHASADERVGIVTFASDSTVVAQPSAQVSSLGAAVQALQTDGSTNMGAGLQAALDMLKGQPNPSVILMTDGWNNDGLSNDQVLGGPVQQAAAGRIPVCAVGLGETPADVDQRLLLDIAGRTGGGYHFVGGGAPLGGDLLACHHSLAGQSLGDLRGTVRQGQVVASPGFAVPAGHRRLTVTLSWPGSQLDARLTDPSGRPVGAGYPGASVVRGPNVAVVTVSNPAGGHWGLSVAGLQTAAAGEQFVASASTDGATARPHRDTLAGALSAPLDETEQQLRLTRTVTAIVAGALVVLWLLGLVTRPFRRRGRDPAAPAPQPALAGVPAQPGYPGSQPGYPGSQPSYAPPPPSGYAVPTWQPPQAGPPTSAGQPVGPAARRASPARGCLGCLLWLVFVVDVLVLGGSAAALYLWTAPLLTYPG